jgi:hypothetical protein
MQQAQRTFEDAIQLYRPLAAANLGAADDAAAVRSR